MDSPARPSQAKMASSTGGTEGSSPASSPASAASLAAMAAPKFGTLVPNRIFVGGISASTSEAELAQLFSAYGNVKATKIIADRGGVSKGYGFVTFETEEEAKRLQQEPECIVLRERKLNIAPAIKKQPFNRSFDGGTGSPPAVPTSTYYYTNGMGLPYQNGMTFYNAGAPAPGAAIAPPADPATLYQAAGVFGPQATTSHQTFAPVMYPVPAPSLYMPQQYQYSPMPYEPYFPGTTAAGAPQFLYATNGAQTSGSGNGSGNNSSGTAAASAAAGANATSPPSAGPSALGPSPPQFQTHFYGPAGAATATHHHPGAMTGGPHGPPPPPPQHVEHLYYSYPAPPHAAAQPPPHHGGPLTLATDQQLLIYSTEISGQPSANESQINQQEDSRSPSSHSEQLQQVGGAATSDGGGGTGGGGGQPSDPSASVVLMPLKYPSPNRYPNFHTMTVHHSTTLPHQDLGGPSGGVSDNGVTAEEAAVHFRGMSIYPTPTTLYIPHGAPYHTGTGNSLLPTPPQQPFDLSSGKFRDYSKPLNRPAAGSPLLHHPPPSYVKQYNGPPPLQGASSHQKYPRVTTPPARMHQYGKRGSAGHHQSLGSPTTYYFSHKSCPQYGGAGASPRQQQFVYAGGQAQIPPYAMPNIQKGYLGGGAGYEYGRSEHEGGGRQRKNAIVNSYRGSNLTISANTSNLSNSSHVDANHANSSSRPGSTKAQTSENAKNAEPSSEVSNAPIAATTTTTTTSSSSNATATNATTTKAGTDTAPAAKEPANRNNNSSSRASSHSPMTHPLPNHSPSPNPNQVQFFGPSSAGGGGGGGGGSGSQRYNSSSTSGGLPHHQQQQQRSSNSRYSMTSSSSSTRGGGKSSSVLRQSSGGGGAGKYKMNGIVQSSGKLPVDEASLGGAGDAPPVGRMPLTPPTTPQQTTTSTGDQSQQLNETCHQMQALSL